MKDIYVRMVLIIPLMNLQCFVTSLIFFLSLIHRIKKYLAFFCNRRQYIFPYVI